MEYLYDHIPVKIHNIPFTPESSLVSSPSPFLPCPKAATFLSYVPTECASSKSAYKHNPSASFAEESVKPSILCIVICIPFFFA